MLPVVSVEVPLLSVVAQPPVVDGHFRVAAVVYMTPGPRSSIVVFVVGGPPGDASPA
jgi:hypothetical protein